MSTVEEKTKQERQQTVSEVKFNIINKDLENEIASKVLFRMLDIYVETGQPVIEKELSLHLPGDAPRKFVVNLYNQKNRMDTVVIKSK